MTSAGREAYRLAREAAPEPRYLDAVRRYAAAVELAASIERVWIEQGRPVIELGGATGRVTVAHPLLGELRRAQAAAAALGSTLGLDPRGHHSIEPARRGRPPGDDPLEALEGEPRLRAVE
jgi:hypothetical protein